ncbi:hypothetical protein [Pukyongiella litopenaei]|uniref:Uncharacterized protein n=1 Tax=Pukyongiella litopenaei TaxID=2605946 RepID=A0A2S0ML64_9RHOB|nr:hypothetical protein [Pukyongiella litopenaei]AVO36619.1 hypothetical protein C6Y53_02165 [Pukyongiella litopenaei]
MTGTRLTDRPVAQQAGILCNDPQFQTFAARRNGYPAGAFSASAAAEYLRSCCGIDSRRELDTTAAARDRFDRLRTEFDAWAGRIARQR